MTSNMPEYYEEVSRRLNGVLDAVGLGEDIRWKRINMWIQSEELNSLESVVHGDHYFGSQAEATTTPGLQSDIDRVSCVYDVAVQDLTNLATDHVILLAVSDQNTPAGYVKLQGVNINQLLHIYAGSDALFKLDRYGRSFVCNDHYTLKDKRCEHHGPANTIDFETRITMDHVLAVRLYGWPVQAYHWLSRNRRYNWPSQETIGLIHRTGALLVPVGHKLSGEKHLEWRLSISYGEKLLVWLFNSAQYKCYILLKMINKSFIKPVVGNDTLSSYHCKTCLFYLIENTPPAMWQLSNLLQCVDLCLRLLYNWIEMSLCPNYFIPEENMFQGKVYGHVRGQLLDVLSNLLRQEGRYLVRISCDRVGQKLAMSCQTPVMNLELQSQDFAEVLRTSVKVLLKNLYAAIPYVIKNYLTFKSRILKRLVYCQDPRREVNTILCKFYCSFIGSKLASESLSKETPDKHGLNIAHDLLLWGSSSDATAGKLKLAAFYLVQDNIDMCKDVLNEIRDNWGYNILDQECQHKFQATLSEHLTITELMSHRIAFMVFGHPYEIHCTPKALIPEMFRSTGSVQTDPGENCLPKLVWVDPRLYLYFLEFLCHHFQKLRSHKKAALGNMIYVIRHESLSSKDTALNLLAYCLTKEGRLVDAYNSLCKSMKLAKGNNAAVWQIATLINAAFRRLRAGQ